MLAAPWWVLGRTSRSHGCPKHHLIISMHTNFLVILGWKVSKKAGCAMARNCSLGNLPSGENYCTEDGSTVRFAAHWISQCTASWCGWKDPTYCKADQNWNWMELIYIYIYIPDHVCLEFLCEIIQFFLEPTRTRIHTLTHTNTLVLLSPKTGLKNRTACSEFSWHFVT